MSTGRVVTIGAAATAVGTLGLAAFVARRLLFPSPYTATVTVQGGAPTGEASFVSSRDTLLPGTYRITRVGDESVRVGEIVGTPGEGPVRRRVDGPVSAGQWRWDALLYDGLDDVPDAGRADPAVAATHVVHVHGQSLGPQQVLRGVGVWNALGASSEVVDLTDLPLRALDAGATERIIARVRAARAAGARRVVLQGWSAGALACAVAASREPVDAVVADAPLLSVPSALRGAVGAAHLPRVVGSLAARIATTAGLARLAGASHPVREATWPDLDVPTLVLHSRADTFVDEADVAALARRAGVDVVAFATAPHTLEWNEDPDRWDDAVRDFARRHTLAG